MGRIVNVAVVGYGGMGGWHTRLLQQIPEVHLAGVYDILPERNKAAEEVGIKAYESYEDVYKRQGEKAVAVLGYRNKDAVILEEDFQKVGAKTLIATDDGSYGHHGLVTDLCQDEEFDCVMACGPAPMLKAVQALAEERGVPCYISLEERMACGIGACLGCAVALKGEDGAQYFGHVCKDGPVFESHRVAW